MFICSFTSGLRIPEEVQIALQETSLKYFQDKFPLQLHFYPEIGNVQLFIETDFNTSFRILCSPVCASLLYLFVDEISPILTIQICARFLRLPLYSIEKSIDFWQKKRVLTYIPHSIALAISLYQKLDTNNNVIQIPNIPTRDPIVPYHHNIFKYISMDDDCSICKILYSNNNNISFIQFLYPTTIDDYKSSVIDLDHHTILTNYKNLSICKFNLYSSSIVYNDIIHTQHLYEFCKLNIPLNISKLLSISKQTEIYAKGFITALTPHILTSLHLRIASASISQ